MALDLARVFVYGTLREGFSNPGRAILDEHARPIDDGWVHGQLHDLGAYPALIHPGEDPAPVHGELYELVHEPAEGLGRLDRYEGARGRDPLPYDRRRLPVEVADGSTREAWTYAWTKTPPPNSRIPSGDWIAYLDAEG